MIILGDALIWIPVLNRRLIGSPEKAFSKFPGSWYGKHITEELHNFLKICRSEIFEDMLKNI